jgi:hypothetical protein
MEDAAKSGYLVHKIAEVGVEAVGTIGGMAIGENPSATRRNIAAPTEPERSDERSDGDECSRENSPEP